MIEELNVLAISGSLRANSDNTSLLRAAQKLNPGGMSIERYEHLDKLPLYNMDIDTGDAPASVADLRGRISSADALLICAPEHNYSVPAALKNAIDWASTDPAGILRHKPIAIAGASATAMGTVRSQLALRQVFLWTESDVVVKPEVMVSRSFERFDADGNLVDETTARLLAELLDSLGAKARSQEP